jgi:hypothetical protein
MEPSYSYRYFCGGGQLGKYVPFLHSETGHSQPLHPIGTIFALNESLHYELHEDACIHVSNSVRNLTGVQAHPDHQNPNGAASHEKTAYICVCHQPLHRLTPFLLQ